jgi:hypothetical protein
MSVISLVKPQTGEPTLADLVAIYKTLDRISQRALLNEAWRLADEERDLDREARWPK